MSDRYLHTRRSSFKSMHCAKSAVEHGPCANESKKQNKNLNEYIQLYSFEYNESCVLWVCVHAACLFIFSTS